jgi:hypothetical protein
MAITYSWNCRTVDTYPTHSDSQESPNTQNDVVYNVHWSLTGTLVHNEVSHSANIIGTQTLDTSDLSDFTSFDSVSHAQMIAWTTGSMESASTGSVDAKYAAVSSSLALKIAPTSVVKYIVDPVVE